MSTSCVTIPVVSGAVGAAVDVSMLAAKKTFVFSGVNTGPIKIQTSFDGVNFCTVKSVAPNQTDLVLVFVSRFIRIDATGAAIGSASVAAERNGIKWVTLPAPAGVGQAGAAVDVTDLGTLNTCIVPSSGDGNVAELQISQDGVEWAQVLSSFAAPDTWQTGEFDAKFARLFSRAGSVGAGFLGAQNSAFEALSEPRTQLIWRPDATGDSAPGGNVYTSSDFQEVYDAIVRLRPHYGLIEVVVESDFSTYFSAPFGQPTALISPPAGGGKWDLSKVQLAGFGAFLEFADGDDYIENLLEVRGEGFFWIYNGATGSPFHDLNDCAFRTSALFVLNTDAGAEPLFLYTGAVFLPFLQFSAEGHFSWFGLPVFFGGPGACPAPLVGARGGALIILSTGGTSFLDNAFETEVGSTILVTTRSGIVNADHDAGPQTYDYPASAGVVAYNIRHNDRSFQNPPATAAYNAIYNETVKCDTTGGDFPVNLPPARGADRVEVIVVAAGAAGFDTANVTPVGGDTINGGAGPVALTGVAAHATFRSDGAGGWWQV